MSADLAAGESTNALSVAEVEAQAGGGGGAAGPRLQLAVEVLALLDGVALLVEVHEPVEDLLAGNGGEGEAGAALRQVEVVAEVKAVQP